MENNSFENIYYDYFTNTSSYVKTIFDLLPRSEEVMRDKSIIRALYNYIMNNASDTKKIEVSYVSSMFYDEISLLSKEEAYKQAEYLYNNFLKKMIYDSINREKFFDIMNECVKVFVGFYSEYQDVSINSIDGIKIKRGNYR